MDIFKQIPNLKPVDPALLEPFRREMREKVIPANVAYAQEQAELWAMRRLQAPMHRCSTCGGISGSSGCCNPLCHAR